MTKSIEVQLADPTTGTWIWTDTLKTAAIGVFATTCRWNRPNLEIVLQLRGILVPQLTVLDARIDVRVPGRVNFFSGQPDEIIGSIVVEGCCVVSINGVRS